MTPYVGEFIFNAIQTFVDPSSLILKTESVNFVLTSALVAWLDKVTSALMSAWEVFEEMASDEPYMEAKSREFPSIELFQLL